MKKIPAILLLFVAFSAAAEKQRPAEKVLYSPVTKTIAYEERTCNLTGIPNSKRLGVLRVEGVSVNYCYGITQDKMLLVLHEAPPYVTGEGIPMQYFVKGVVDKNGKLVSHEPFDYGKAVSKLAEEQRAAQKRMLNTALPPRD